jgi:hypothetical protein
VSNPAFSRFFPIMRDPGDETSEDRPILTLVKIEKGA